MNLSRAFTATSLFAAVLLLGTGAAPKFDPAPYVHAQRLVDVGGRHLNLYCTGKGAPAVILDTDGDDSTATWAFVQPIVARSTRVCSYDAAGLGFSDPAHGPRDAQAFVNDLHALLAKARIAPPYVLVGYSLSGLFDRLYADKYPGQIAGMVLVDPNVIARGKRLAALAPALKGAADTAGFVAYLNACRVAAQKHQLVAGTHAFKECMWGTGTRDPKFPLAVQHALERQWQRPGAWQDIMLAVQAGDTDDAEVRKAQRSYGDMPLIVLTPDVQIDLKGLPISKHDAAKVERAYTVWEAHIAAFSSRGTAFVVTGSSHAIAEDRPSAVVSAIDEVVQQSR